MSISITEQQLEVSVSENIVSISTVENVISVAVTENSSDLDAIHKSISNELTDLVEKVTPASNDWAVIEDSADGYKKKKVKVSALTGSGSVVDSVNGETGVVVLDTGDISEVTNKKYVTDAEKSTWNGKQNALGYTPEDVANKENTTINTNTTKYPTVNLLNSGLNNLESLSIAYAIAL